MKYEELKIKYLQNDFNFLFDYLLNQHPDKSNNFFDKLFDELNINSENIYTKCNEKQIELYQYLGSTEHLYDYSKNHKISSQDKLILSMA